ncbi:hypothetical protein Fmac_023203 [Flemingia macrophylla]|uniref:Response regulatory domain-containing protein n=1 Tax=Flemingia macrophylla TaxID=520843 RepID=A0ABD1LKW4_9FABA
MEDGSISLSHFVPSFARGFDLLLVHNDTMSLVYLSSLLKQYSFKVTATSDASAAASMILHHEGKFKLIMAKANMPGMNDLSFLDIVLKKNIPVISIYSGGFDDVTQKALATGLCYVLKEPICSHDLKYLWQQMYSSRAHSAKRTQNEYSQYTEYHAKGLENIKMKQVVGANGERHNDGNGDMLKRKRTVSEKANTGSLRSTQVNFNNYYKYYSSLNRLIDANKRAIVWTPELHLKFAEAIQARPKQILSRMNEPYLTVRQVASHLQKYKLRLKREENAGSSDLPLVSTASSLGTKEHKIAFDFDPGLPAPKASLKESHIQNQNFLVNNAGTEESEILKTGITVCGSQSPDSTVAQPVSGASVDQNHPQTLYDDFMKKFMENSDNFDLYKNEINPDDVNRYCEMLLRTILDGNDSRFTEPSNGSVFGANENLSVIYVNSCYMYTVG